MAELILKMLLASEGTPVCFGAFCLARGCLSFTLPPSDSLHCSFFRPGSNFFSRFHSLHFCLFLKMIQVGLLCSGKFFPQFYRAQFSNLLHLFFPIEGRPLVAVLFKTNASAHGASTKTL